MKKVFFQAKKKQTALSHLVLHQKQEMSRLSLDTLFWVKMKQILGDQSGKKTVLH